MSAFALIVADPPWSYKNFSDAAHGAAVSAYDTMRYDEIAAIPVASWAAETCVLALWGTWPKLEEAVQLVWDWGFEFKTGFPWVKTLPQKGEIRRGIGFWVQGASEFVLIGTKGEPERQKTAPQIGLLCGSERQFYAPRLEHSKKPEDLQSWLEARFAGPRLELFARRERPGWTTWGRDTGFVLSAEGVKAVEAPAEALPLFDGKVRS